MYHLSVGIGTFNLSNYNSNNGLLVSFSTDTSSLIILCTIIISTIIKSAISFSYWSTTTLIHKMPIETRIWSMLCTFML